MQKEIVGSKPSANRVRVIVALKKIKMGWNEWEIRYLYPDER